MNFRQYLNTGCSIIHKNKLNYYVSMYDFDYYPINDDEVVIFGAYLPDVPECKKGYLSTKKDTYSYCVDLCSGYYIVIPSVPKNNLSYQPRITDLREMVFTSQLDFKKALDVAAKFNLDVEVGDMKITFLTYQDLIMFKKEFNKNVDETISKINTAIKLEEFDI